MDILPETAFRLESIKQELLVRFPKEKAEGLNVSRVEDFIANKGMIVKPTAIFDKDKFLQVKDIAGDFMNVRSQAFEQGAKALYIPEIDIVLVQRDIEMEETNGAIYTEGLLAHELAHGSSMYRGFVVKESGFYTPRTGFCLSQNNKKWGWFLEEGFGEMIRGDYIEQNQAEHVDKMKDVFNFGELSASDTFPMTTAEGYKVSIPLKYLYLTADRKPTCIVSSTAGWGLELVCRKRNGLESKLISGRASINDLRKVVGEINSITPNLYSYLQNSDSSQEDNNRKLDYIITTLYRGVENTISGSDQIKGLWK